MLWLVAFHIVAVVCWFAALFYLPRLFVYHVQALQEGDTQGGERFKIMERKLYRGIMLPSAVLAIGFGTAIIMMTPALYLSQGWMQAKLALVFLLIGYHVHCWIYQRQFADDRNTKSETFYRIFNEVPVVLLLAIVILVVVKPG